MAPWREGGAGKGASLTAGQQDSVEEDTEDEGDRSRDGEQSAEQQLLNDDKGAESDWILIGYW